MIADGAPTVFSEESYDDRSKWDLAIEEAIQNSSINRIYLPEKYNGRQNTAEKSNGNVYWFSAEELSAPSGIRPVRKRNRYKYVLASFTIMTVVCAGAAVGWFFQDQNLRTRKAAEVAQTDEREAEVSRLDIVPIIDHCVETLGEFWPMAPEWTLVEEGCVVVPDQLPRGLPDIQTRNAFSFRLYRLVGRWNEFLAGHAAERVMREFNGSIRRDASSIMLYRDVAPTRRIIEHGFQPESDVNAALDRLFVGHVKVGEGAGSRRGVIGASTALELLAVLDRMKTDTLEAISVIRELDSGMTRIRARPVLLQTERTRTTGRDSRND